MRVGERFGDEAAFGIDLIPRQNTWFLADVGDAPVSDGDIEQLIALVP